MKLSRSLTYMCSDVEQSTSASEYPIMYIQPEAGF
jgi:hypothetical protein